MPATFFKSGVAYSFSRLVFVFIVLIAGLAVTKPVDAQEPATEIEIFDVTQQDLNEDGQPDLTIIECAFITNYDRVLVYDRGSDMRDSNIWQEATDFENDLWVFDAAADDQVELIIDFQKTAEGLMARLWDDENGDGTVPYRLSPEITVREKFGPSVVVIAPDGWWTRDGKTNFNLDLRVDGQIQASFSAKPWLHFVKTDGKPDFLIQVRDSDEDGRPDFQWINAWPQARGSSYAVHRTEITVNPRDDEPPVTGSIFWPFLGSTYDWDKQQDERPSRLSTDDLNIRQEQSGYTKFYNVSMPPIQMLWDKGVLLYVGEFVTSRFNDDNWFVYSIRRVEPGDVSPVNFEAPFAFYDMAADDDGYPELAIRFEHYLERDQFPFREQNLEPVQVLRYSWDQDNDTTWDYKLQLVGRHPITDMVTVGDLALKMIPPPILPEWVTTQTWDGATFVAAETDERWTSEGIYEWNIIGRWRDEYVTGLSSVPPSPNQLDELIVGQRGEYVFDLHRRPELYMSSVDRKLHLRGAEGGIWRISETRGIQYANLGGDYINQWTLIENGEPVRSLYAVADQIIYTDRTGVQFTQTDSSPAFFTVRPPTNNEERQGLERRLQTHQPPDSVPWDFAALSAQFGSPYARIDGASIQDLRLTSQGFRFVLTLEPGFRGTDGADLDLSTLGPGEYLVTYDGTFDVTSLTPPELNLSIRATSPDRLQVGLPTTVLVEARNEGLHDAKDLLLIIRARRDRVSIDIAHQRIDVLSGIPEQLTLNWKPLVEGAWELEAWLGHPDGKIVPLKVKRSVDVTRMGTAPRGVVHLSAGGGWQVLPSGITLLALVTITVSLVRLVLDQREWKKLDRDPGVLE